MLVLFQSKIYTETLMTGLMQAGRQSLVQITYNYKGGTLKLDAEVLWSLFSCSCSLLLLHKC